MKKNILISLFTISALLNGCGTFDNAFDDIHVEPNISLPLGSIGLNDQNLFSLGGSGQIEVNKNGVITFVIKHDGDFTSDNVLNSVFSFPDQDLDINVAIPDGSLSVPEGTLVDIEQLSPGGLIVNLNIKLQERLDKMIFEGGSVVLNLNNPNGYDFSQLVCTTKDLLKDGKPIQLKNGERVNFKDGSQYTIAPHNDNVFTLLFTEKIPFMPNLVGDIELSISDFSHIEGYFGHKEINKQTTNIKTPADFESFSNKVESVYLSDPSIDISIQNAFDAPTILLIENLNATIMENGVEKTVVLMPIAGKDRIFMNGIGKFSLTLNNSCFLEGSNNISSMMVKGLKNIQFVVNSIINPTKEEIGGFGPDPLPDNEVVNILNVDEKMSGSFDIEIPIEGVIKDINITDTIPIGFLNDFSTNGSALNELTMAFYGVNTMPLDIKIMAQVREGDREDGAVTNVFKDPIVVPGSNGKRQDETGYQAGHITKENMQIATFDKEIMDKLTKSKKLFLNISGSTFESDKMTNIRFYSPADLSLNTIIGLRGDLNITPSDEQ